MDELLTASLNAAKVSGAAFAEARVVRTRRQAIAPSEVGHRSMSIGQLGIIAMKVGRKLKWDPVNECFIGDEDANKMLSRPMRNPWHL